MVEAEVDVGRGVEGSLYPSTLPLPLPLPVY